MRPEIQRFEDPETMSQAAAMLVFREAVRNVEAKGVFHLALSGGKTPERFHEILAGGNSLRAFPWESTHLFWGDERCVPADDSLSNYGTARRNLLSKVPIPEENIHRIPGEIRPPEAAADRYERILRDRFPKGAEQRGCLFDLIVLGVGADGHTASLFPGPSIETDETRWVRSIKAPPGVIPEERITLTLPAINASETVLFLVLGKEKQRVVRDILREPETALCKYPAAKIQARKQLIWFLCGFFV